MQRRRGPVAPRVEDGRVEEVQQRPHFGEVVLAAGQARRHTHRRSAPHPAGRTTQSGLMTERECTEVRRSRPVDTFPHLLRDRARPVPHLHRDWARPLPYLHRDYSDQHLQCSSSTRPLPVQPKLRLPPRAPPRSIRCHPSPLPLAWDWLAKVSSACLQQSEPEAACPSARAAAPSGSSCSGPWRACTAAAAAGTSHR